MKYHNHQNSYGFSITFLQTFLGLIYQNENDCDGMLEILKDIHHYVPFCGEGVDRQYASQGSLVTNSL